MPQNQSSVEDLTAAADYLARTAAFARVFRPEMQKAANPSAIEQAKTWATDQLGKVPALAQQAKDVVTGAPTQPAGFADRIKAHFAQNPGQLPVALGGGGALLGAGAGLLADRSREEEDRTPWTSAMTGALAGGAIGGGVGLMKQHAPNIVAPPSELEQAHKDFVNRERSALDVVLDRFPTFGQYGRKGLAISGGIGVLEASQRMRGIHAFDPYAMQSGFDKMKSSPDSSLFSHMDKSVRDEIASRNKGDLAKAVRSATPLKHSIEPKLLKTMKDPVKLKAYYDSLQMDANQAIKATMDAAEPDTWYGRVKRVPFKHPSLPGLGRFPRWGAYGAPVAGGVGIDYLIGKIKDWQAADLARRKMQYLTQPGNAAQ